jgi:hypothetical protein
MHGTGYCEAYPGLTLCPGLEKVVHASFQLGLCSTFKAHEFFTGRIERIPYMTFNTGDLFCASGARLLMEGCKPLAPILGIAVAVYIIRKIVQSYAR